MPLPVIRSSYALTSHSDKTFRRLHPQFPSPEILHRRMPARINARRVLTGMTIHRLPFLLLRVGNVNEVGWMKSHRLLAGANLETSG